MRRERTAYSTTQSFGLALMATAMIVVTIVTFLVIDTDESFWPVAAAAIVFAFVAWRFDALWARIVGLLGTLAIGAGAFFFAFGIFQPFSPLEFIVGLIFTAGFLFSLGAGIMAIAVGRKRDPGPSETGRRVRMATVGVISVASVVSVAGFLATRTTVSDAEAQGAATLEIVNFEFEPGTETIAAGQNLLLKNEDAFAHDFTLEELDIVSHLGPGSETIVDLGSAPPGTYQYFCSLHTDPATGEGMTGTITIEG